MGVVRDVTIDQLIQAVQGISTTGISDTTGQAINTTLGTLGKDTTLQAIVSALQTIAGTISPSALNVTFNNSGTDLTSSNVESAIKEVYNKEKEWTLLSNSTMELNDTLDITGCGREIMIEINSNPTSPSNRGRIIVPVRKDGANFYIAGGSNNSLVLVRLSISSSNILTFVNISNTNLRIQGVFI